MSGTRRIPSFDGFRALSIVFVVISHSFSGLKNYISLGNLGVRIFFIISAYLIIGILYRSSLRSDLSLKRFYFKRLARTLPAFYFYLLAVLIVMLLVGDFEWNQFWRAPVFLENYHPRSHWTSSQWYIGHSWSLAVEEQFYLLSALVFFQFQKRQKSMLWLNTILVVVMLIPSILRIAYIFLPAPEILAGSSMRSFETVADALAVGGLFYLNKDRVLALPPVRFLNKNIGIVWLLVFTIPMLSSKILEDLVGLMPTVVYMGVGVLVLNICIAILLIHYADTEKQTIVWKFLNTKWMIQIGILSYSIYLWQQVWTLDWDIHFIFKLIGITISALISYHVVEKPILAWRDRVSSSMNS